MFRLTVPKNKHIHHQQHNFKYILTRYQNALLEFRKLVGNIPQFPETPMTHK